MKRLELKSKLLFLIVISLLFNSCDFAKRKIKGGINKVVSEFAEVFDEYLTLPDRTIKRDVLEEELYGNWNITERSLKIIDSQLINNRDWESISFSSLRFKLKKDKTIEAWVFEKYEPISFFKFPVSIVDSTMISGKWTVEKDIYSNREENKKYKNKVNLTFDFEGNRSYLIDFYIVEENGALFLWSYIGDPDQLYYQEYIKK